MELYLNLMTFIPLDTIIEISSYGDIIDESAVYFTENDVENI